MNKGIEGMITYRLYDEMSSNRLSILVVLYKHTHLNVSTAHKLLLL